MERYYRVLGLSRGAASEADVKRAYRQKALLFHPDRNPNGVEAFKALQDAYEAALTDVKRGGGGGTGQGRSGPYTAAPSPFSMNAFGSSTSAGAAYHHARASAPTQEPFDGRNGGPPPSPLFTEEDLFGDAIPGGWRDAGSQRWNAQPDGKGPFCQGSGDAGATGSQASDSAEARWRRAHGSRVPMSAYDGRCPVPPPPRAAPSQSSPPAPSAKANSSSTAFPATSASSSKCAGRQPRSSTQAEWDAFMARDHPWKSSSATQQAAQSSSDDESPEDRIYREAMFLARQAQKLGEKNGPRSPTNRQPTRDRGPLPSPCTAPSSSTSVPASTAKPPTPNSKSSLGDTHETCSGEEEARRRQRQSAEASLHGSKNGQDGVSHQEPHEAEAGDSNAEINEGENDEMGDTQRRADMATSSTRSPQASDTRCSSRLANELREAMMRERRLLSREYMSLRYMPDPADVGEMSDMEVYLLAEALREVQVKVQAVLSARLAKGPCSACTSQPRDASRQPFACPHRSICELCFKSGVLSCPLCGAARTAAEDEGMGDTMAGGVGE
ncbi:hypothetical protein ABL78_7531 [Leptomonas seymouri]|uniref:J domain-containing protein n=1 Tax=Leptomonas seymouri TaxID=5684 RepID=A0A0N1PC79_LEPSE|nr:hypothetical protein ABL78_7531 [Leptomonas seymouri]|eukprot:KPI83433.1 hypothetical protein ABL78_7531 [Leptomonas seymouri]